MENDGSGGQSGKVKTSMSNLESTRAKIVAVGHDLAAQFPGDIANLYSDRKEVDGELDS
jgi:hypothetical protein